ncbi:MAG: PilZ domain-containing protein [Gammaproteobacteria bacterium]|nr:PilZ domain-containing protein [Gammaproteobacteria bacterium]
MPNILRKEKRQYPRIRARLPLKIISPDGKVLPATSLDMSLEGIQIECNHLTQQQLILDHEKEKPGQPVELNVQLKIPATKHSKNKVEIRCRLVVSRRLAQDTYHLGLNYLDFEDTEHLETFLDKQLYKSA